MNSLCSSCTALTLRASVRPSLLVAPATIQAFSTSTIHAAQKVQAKGAKVAKERAAIAARRKKKKHPFYKMPDLTQLTQYSLVDAMHFIKAFEVGQPPTKVKFDLAVRLRTKKDGPVLRNSIRLPHAVKDDIRVCVICPLDSKQGRAAKAAGAVLVGEEDVFDLIKAGKINFDRCITTPESLPKIQKAGIARILGPRGLMPSVKLGTVTENVTNSVTNMLGASTYRERQGVIRMAVAQLGCTAEQLRDNVAAFIGQLRKEGSALAESQGFSKEVFEVVLSSTNAPGFSLNGSFKGPNSVPTQQLGVVA